MKMLQKMEKMMKMVQKIEKMMNCWKERRGKTLLMKENWMQSQWILQLKQQQQQHQQQQKMKMMSKSVQCIVWHLEKTQI